MICIFATKSIHPTLKLCKHQCHGKAPSTALPRILEQLLDKEGIQDPSPTSLMGNRLRILRKGCL